MLIPTASNSGPVRWTTVSLETRSALTVYSGRAGSSTWISPKTRRSIASARRVRVSATRGAPSLNGERSTSSDRQTPRIWSEFLPSAAVPQRTRPCCNPRSEQTMPARTRRSRQCARNSGRRRQRERAERTAGDSTCDPPDIDRVGRLLDDVVHRRTASSHWAVRPAGISPRRTRSVTPSSAVTGESASASRSNRSPCRRTNRFHAESAVRRRRSRARSPYRLRRARSALVQSSGSSSPVSVATAPPNSPRALLRSAPCPPRPRLQGSRRHAPAPEIARSRLILQLPCQLDRDRLAEPRVSLEQAVTADGRSRAAANHARPARPPTAPSRSEAPARPAQLPGQFPNRLGGAVACDDDAQSSDDAT